MYININYKLLDIFGFIVDIVDAIEKFTHLGNNFDCLEHDCKRQRLSVELEDSKKTNYLNNFCLKLLLFFWRKLL